MAEDFQAGICGENWWNINPSRSVFSLGSSPCSMAANDSGSYNSSWQNGIVSDNSLGFLDSQKTQQMDCTLQMMGFGLASSSTGSANWNQSPLRCSGRPEGSNFHSVIQEEARPDSNSSQIQVSTIDAFKPMNQEFSNTDQQSLSSLTSTGNSTLTNCQGLCGSFPVGSASYGLPSSTLMIQSLYDVSEPQLQPLFTNPSVDYNSSTANYGSSSNEISPTWSKVASFLKPSLAKQQASGLHFSNNTPFWNASAAALNDTRAGVFASSQPQYQPSPNFDEKPNFQSLLTKPKSEEVQDSSLPKKNACEPVFKRPRVETPSPLPTFKVRKEKLGDRITALQQLVSPFGKTDTASVLHEAIEYIKFLHDQVNALSTPYMKNGAPTQHQQGCDMKDLEGSKQDLRSRGLCLVPISSTFPVANETTADFWTPTFGGAFISNIYVGKSKEQVCMKEAEARVGEEKKLKKTKEKEGKEEEKGSDPSKEGQGMLGQLGTRHND